MDPSDLKVTLAGSGRVLREIDPTAVRIVTQLESLEEGPQRRRVTAEDVEVPVGVAVLRVEPAWVTFVARRTTEVEVRVEPTVRGELGAGMRLKEVRAEPESVTLVVPLRSQARYQTVRTEPVELSSVRRDDERRVDIVLPKDARLAEGEPAAVDVHIAVAGGEEAAATSTREGG
jgi:YbbR domain-containing protein